jgi:hypothetical protein
VIKHPGAGRPIYKDAEWVEIRISGNKDEIRDRAVRENDKRLFPREYAAFKAGAEAPLEGTPLESVPFLTPAQVMELRAFGCRTAEHVRDMADANAQKFMGMHSIRQRLRDFLAAAEGAAPMLAMRAELERVQSEKDAQVAALQEQINALTSAKKSKGA